MSTDSPPTEDAPPQAASDASAERSFGLRQLVDLAIVHGGMGSYTQKRYDTLRSALELKTDLLARNGGREALKLRIPVEADGRRRTVIAGAPGVAHHAVMRARSIRDRAGLSSPFAGYLEASPDVHELWLAHEATLKESIQEAKRADAQLIRNLVRLAIAAVLSVEPEVEGRRVTEGALRAVGWPDPPPPPDNEWLQ